MREALGKRGGAAAVTRLLYYGGIRLSGLPPELRAALIARRPCSAGVGRFTASPRFLRGLLPPGCPGGPRRFLDIAGGRVVSVPEPRVSPAPLAGPGCRGEGGVSSGPPFGGPVGRQPRPSEV